MPQANPVKVEKESGPQNLLQPEDFDWGQDRSESKTNEIQKKLTKFSDEQIRTLRNQTKPLK